MVGRVLVLCDRRVFFGRRRVEASDGRSWRLTASEVRLLAYLADRPHQTISKSELRQQVFDMAPAVRSRAVDSALARLRDKIEPDAADPVHLKTVWAKGVQFCPIPSSTSGVEEPRPQQHATAASSPPIVINASSMRAAEDWLVAATSRVPWSRSFPVCEDSCIALGHRLSPQSWSTQTANTTLFGSIQRLIAPVAAWTVTQQSERGEHTPLPVLRGESAEVMTLARRVPAGLSIAELAWWRPDLGHKGALRRVAQLVNTGWLIAHGQHTVIPSPASWVSDVSPPRARRPDGVAPERVHEAATGTVPRAVQVQALALAGPEQAFSAAHIAYQLNASHALQRSVLGYKAKNAVERSHLAMWLGTGLRTYSQFHDVVTALPTTPALDALPVWNEVVQACPRPLVDNWLVRIGADWPNHVGQVQYQRARLAMDSGDIESSTVVLEEAMKAAAGHGLQDALWELAARLHAARGQTTLARAVRQDVARRLAPSPMLSRLTAWDIVAQFNPQTVDACQRKLLEAGDSPESALCSAMLDAWATPTGNAVQRAKAAERLIRSSAAPDLAFVQQIHQLWPNSVGS